MRFFAPLSLLFIVIFLSGCAKTAEQKEIKKSKEGITIRLEGEVYPSQKEDILATEDGRIKALYIHIGDRVKKGEPLVKFETTVTKYDIERVKNELAYLQDFKKFLQKSGKKGIDLALVNIARLNLEQISKLKSKGYSNHYELNTAKAAYASSLHAKYTESENFAQKLQQLNERINKTKSELKKLQHQLLMSEVRSDIAGIVADIKTQVGDFVSRGTPLGTIVNLDKVIVKAGVAAGLLPFVKKGKRVKIDFITEPPYSVKAKIDKVVMVVDPDFGKMTAQIVIPNRNYLLQEGTKALVTVYLNKEEQEFIKKNFIEKPGKTVYEVKSFNE